MTNRGNADDPTKNRGKHTLYIDTHTQGNEEMIDRQETQLRLIKQDETTRKQNSKH